ncbi:uncharacterized protein Z519_11896 [Cladophialophora bantiana CBS 173.52]|uniref:Uncharacterized protein n=1 Tax=Cladophialophora bantiana (strain ATCC 10958 / CBS 173.52 / CDC B-1940 / NIH 8579) TaxID=1442370 RepID=A0A0D2EBV8_CLAB1|nr:uncharacterized protein Z519_11896 [Cladophialophora bantiana CBS 173.52]KIW87571.1 hypothetical protein Z519_11896 [Cladophialophora bantiana CBS 173.52]
MDDINMTLTTETEISLSHEGPATVEPTEPAAGFVSAFVTDALKFPKRMSADSIDAMRGASEYGMEGSGKDGNRQMSKRRRGPEFRCPYFAANPETCQDAKCQSWHNPCIAAVTRHALRDSNKNDATGSQSRAIKSLSHRKLSAEDRWKHYYEIHGGVDAYEQRQPYWQQPVKGDRPNLQTGQPAPSAGFSFLSRKAEHVTVPLHPRNPPLPDFDREECNSIDIQSMDDLSQTLLELIARKEARDEAIDTEIKEREAKKIAELRSEIAQEKLAEKSKNQSDFVAGLKKIIMHSHSMNLPLSVPAGSSYEQPDKAQPEEGIRRPEATGSRRSNSPREP